MNIFRLFGIGGSKIRRADCSIPGTITAVSRCWWITINTKPVRRYPGDGALHPSIITFSYRVNDIPYVGKLYVPHTSRTPQVGETIPVFYDPANPKKYACYASGPAGP